MERFLLNTSSNPCSSSWVPCPRWLASSALSMRQFEIIESEAAAAAASTTRAHRRRSLSAMRYQSLSSSGATTAGSSRNSSFDGGSVAGVTSVVHFQQQAPKTSRSVVDDARDAGLLHLTPSDLVFEVSPFGISYYDFAVSFCPSRQRAHEYVLYLSKFDEQTNLEYMESVVVSAEFFLETNYPRTDLALITLALLVWRKLLNKAKVLCLIRSMDSTAYLSLEALKKVAQKYKCEHHLQVIKTEALRPKKLQRTASLDSMRLRMLTCQTRTQLDALPASAVREAKALLCPDANKLLCICFPIL